MASETVTEDVEEKTKAERRGSEALDLARGPVEGSLRRSQPLGRYKGRRNSFSDTRSLFPGGIEKLWET